MAARQMFHEIHTSKGKCNLWQVNGKHKGGSEHCTTNPACRTQKYAAYLLFPAERI
jgi:hypothetical protein